MPVGQFVVLNYLVGLKYGRFLSRQALSIGHFCRGLAGTQVLVLGSKLSFKLNKIT